MNEQPRAVAEGELSNSFLGDTIQVCVVTPDLRRTVDGFIRLGIGPWRVYTFGPGSATEQTYRGKAQPHSMRLALGTSGNMMWEIIQPLEGPSIYKDYLERQGEGVQHVGQTCRDIPFDTKVAQFRERGCEIVQSGKWRGVRYAYFETVGVIGTTVEIFDFPADFIWPEPEEWIPGPPP